MKNLKYLLVLVYIFLYVSHIIFGPYYLHYLYKNEKFPRRSKNMNEVLKKSIYITYVSILFTIYFLLFPNTESYIVALLCTTIALLSYIVVYFNSEYFYISLFDHSVLVLPFIYYYFAFNIILNKYEFGKLSYIFIIYLILHLATYKYFYH